jgi:hypothetical protein
MINIIELGRPSGGGDCEVVIELVEAFAELFYNPLAVVTNITILEEIN